MKEFVCVAAFAATLASCGSITRGTQEEVAIDVQPAHAQVTTNIGASCTGSCVLKVPRKQSFTVSASAAGYQPQTVPVGTRISGGGGAAMAGNIVFGGLIGAAIDTGSGAMLDHYPNPVVIRLQPAADPLAPQPPAVGPLRTPAPPAPATS